MVVPSLIRRIEVPLFDLRLSASRFVLTDTTPPGPDICGAPINPQLPIVLFALVVDAAGRPLADSPVTFYLEGTVGACVRIFGKLCTPTGTGTSITLCTDALGMASARFAVTDAEIAACPVRAGPGKCGLYAAY